MELMEGPELRERLEKIEQRLSHIEERIGTAPEKIWYSRKDLAELRGVALNTFYNQPELLPNYGVPDDTAINGRWHKDSVDAWMREPLDKWKHHWRMLSEEERQTLRDGRVA